MQDTAQPSAAAETDAMAEAAMAFKVELGQAERPAPERDEQGRFASTQPEEPETSPDIEEVTQADDAPEEAAEEAQPEVPPMPTSWSADKAEIWGTLPAEAQEYISERDAQVNQAANAKFQEAANARKVYEDQAVAASETRQELVATMDQLMQAMIPEPPSLSMLQQGSYDYNPDGYHLLKAQYDQSLQGLQVLADHRQQLLGQQEHEQRQIQQTVFHEVNSATLPALHRDVPQLATNPASHGPFMQELAEYAIGQGVPRHYFTESPLPAVEWHMLWKAKQFDEGQKTLVKARQQPAPEPKRASPPVRPGVTTARSTVQRQQRSKDYARLSETGSIADGAAMFKHFLR